MSGFVDGMVLGSVPEEMAEPGSRKANVTGAEAGDKVNVAKVDINLCAGCWEVLADICGCGATRLCADCVYVRLRGSVAEASHSGIQGEGQGEQSIEKELREELLTMANNFQRMGDMVDVFGGLSRELADIRASMDSREDMAMLASRVCGLEGGTHLETPAVMDDADESDFWSR